SACDFACWTRHVIRDLRPQRSCTACRRASVAKLRAEIGLTAQKPRERAYQRDPEAIEAWKRHVYPARAKRARAEKADIYFWDESGFRADAVHGKTWAERGNTPIVHRPGQRQSISAASAGNSKGPFWYALY